jgi:hypothetical protein
MSKDIENPPTTNIGDEKSTAIRLLEIITVKAEEIRQILKGGEADGEFLGRENQVLGRNQFIHSILNELEQVTLALTVSEETIGEEIDTSDHDEMRLRITANTYSVVQREHSLHIRRLTEALVDLISFCRTNSSAYYIHYLLYADLEELQKDKHDLKEYFNCENQEISDWIVTTMAKIAAVEVSLDLEKCWYLKGNYPKPSGKAQPASFMSRFNNAISAATRSERLALGFYYGRAYREPSRSIHLRIVGLASLKAFDNIQFQRVQISLLAASCLNRCYQLLGIRSHSPKGGDSGLSTVLRKPSVTEVHNAFIPPHIAKGDFVVVSHSLYEVVASAKSTFGYKSYKLKYLAGQPAHSEEDWHPAIDIRKFADAEELRQDMVKALGLPNRLSRSEQLRLRKALRQAAIELWDQILQAQPFFSALSATQKEKDELWDQILRPQP